MCMYVYMCVCVYILLTHIELTANWFTPLPRFEYPWDILESCQAVVFAWYSDFLNSLAGISVLCIRLLGHEGSPRPCAVVRHIKCLVDNVTDHLASNHCIAH